MDSQVQQTTESANKVQKRRIRRETRSCRQCTLCMIPMHAILITIAHSSQAVCEKSDAYFAHAARISATNALQEEYNVSTKPIPNQSLSRRRGMSENGWRFWRTCWHQCKKS